MIVTIGSDAVAPAVGPYHHVTVLGDLVFCSGNVGVDTDTRLVSNDVTEQAHKTFDNMSAVLKETESDLDHGMKATVFLTDMADYPAENAAYAEAFGRHASARSCVVVAALPLGALVEIEAIAKISQS